MEKKIAIPINDADTLDAHFGHCKFFAFITIKDGVVVAEEKIVPPPHEPGLLPQWMAEHNATDVIAGGMGRKAIDLLNQNNIDVYVGAPQLTIKEITEGYINNTLSYTTNYCNHDENHTCAH